MSDILPKGWIVRFDGDYTTLIKVYYNPETQQLFHKKEDFDRYINYFTKATHLHGTEPLWKVTTEDKDPKGKAVLTNMLEEEEEEDENLGSIFVPKEACLKSQSSTSKETLSKTYEEVGEDSSNVDDDDDDDDNNDDEYKPRKRYKRQRKQNDKETESAQKEDGKDDDHRPPTTTPRRRRNNWPSRNRNGCGNSSRKAN